MTEEQIDAILARIGPALREAREEIGLRQQDVSDAAKLPENLLHKYETGKNIPRPDVLYRTLEALTLDFVDFFERLTAPFPGLKTPQYAKAAPDVQAAVTAAMLKILKRDGYTTRHWARLHKSPDYQQWAQYERGSMPSLRTILRFCLNAKIDWLYFWADVQGRIDGGKP